MTFDDMPPEVVKAMRDPHAPDAARVLARRFLELHRESARLRQVHRDQLRRYGRADLDTWAQACEYRDAAKDCEKAFRKAMVVHFARQLADDPNEEARFPLAPGEITGDDSGPPPHSEPSP